MPPKRNYKKKSQKDSGVIETTTETNKGEKDGSPNSDYVDEDDEPTSTNKRTNTAKKPRKAYKKKLPKPTTSKKDTENLINSAEDVVSFYDQLQSSSLLKTEPAEKQMKLLGRNLYKMEKLYGLHNKTKLLKVGEALQKFDTSLIGFQDDSTKDMVDTTVYLHNTHINDVLLSQKWDKISTTEFQEHFQTKDQRPKKIIFDDPDKLYSIEPNTHLDFPIFQHGRRDGKIYNIDGVVTDMVFTPQLTEAIDKQYLVVAKSQYNDTPLNPNMVLLQHQEQPHYSCIEVFEIDSSVERDTCFKKIVTFLHKFGELTNLKILPIKNERHIPLLCCTQQGTVELFSLQIAFENSAVPEIVQLQNSAQSVKMEGLKITCFDMINETSVLVGLENGYVAEFDLLDTENSAIPSYFLKIQESLIFSIAVAQMNGESTVVATVSGDGSVKVFDPKDVLNSLVVLRKARTLSTCEIGYSPLCHGFTYSDGFGTLKIACASALYFSPYLSLHEFDVTTNSSSRFHPLTLSGGNDGNLYVFNSLKKLVTPQRAINSVYRTCRLWNWSYQKDNDVYRLDGNYKLQSVSANTDTKLDVIKPPGTNISCCRWNGTPSGIDIFAFVNNAGLLIVEKLS